MEVKATKENITIGALIAAIAGGVYAMEDRYVTHAIFQQHLHEDRYVDEPTFNNHVVYSEISELESRLERLQDKLAYFLAIPTADRRAWQREEIERLKAAIQRIRDKIDRMS